MREWDVERSAFAPAVSLGYAGMMAGGALAGIAGDRFGRRQALLGSVAVFGAMTLATAAVNDMAALAVLRFLAGIGLGGALPNAATLAAEFVPRAQRPMAVTATIVCVPLGAMLAGILGSQLLATTGLARRCSSPGASSLSSPWRPWRGCCRNPRASWRAIRRDGRSSCGSPESSAVRCRPTRRSRIRRKRTRRLARRSRRSSTPSSGATRSRSGVSFCSCLLAVYLGFSWLPTVLAGAGFGPGVASSGITAFNLGGVVGALVSGAVMSRIGSRAAMLTMSIGAIAGAITLSMMKMST